MKKIILNILTAGTVLILTGCGAGSNSAGKAVGTKPAAKIDTAMTVTISSSDELKEITEKDVKDTIASLNQEYQQLKKDVDSYEKYEKNIDKMEAFYEKVCDTNKELCLRMREYSWNYAQKIVLADQSNDEKYEELDTIYDYVYDDAGDDIYDEIYDGIMEEIYDDYYDGIVEDGYDSVPYEEWSDMLSDEYDRWSDAVKETYREWSDSQSDIYRFGSDVKSEVYSNDMDRAKDKLRDFKEDIEKMKEE